MALENLPTNKTVLVTSANGADHYWVGSVMHVLRTEFRHGKKVDKVSLMSRHHMAIGEAINVRGLDGNIIATVLVKSLQMVNPELLDDADFTEMGYRDRVEYMADWGEIFGRRVWLLRIERL